MAHSANPLDTPVAGRRPMSLAVVATSLFALAAMLAAAPALSSGPYRWAGLAFLVALTPASAIALTALRRRPLAPAPATLEALVEALAEPAAIVAADGAIEGSNGAWRSLVGASRRLERTVVGARHALLRNATRGARASEPLEVGGETRLLDAARLDGGRFLVRIASPPTRPPAPDVAAQPVAGAAPDQLDAFAAASPFGAALIDDEDPFAGAIQEVNPAWAAIAGVAAEPGAKLGPALTEESRNEAAQRLAAGGVGPFEVTPAAAPERVAHLYVTRLSGRSVAYLVDVTDQKQMQGQLV
jgi:two-component system, cell cycle sensor histidine kinase and response regulator CckA